MAMMRPGAEALRLSVTFGVGAAIGHAVTSLVPGAGTLLTVTPLLWSWKVVALVAGAQLANEHQWVSHVVSATLHGCLLTIAYIVVDRAVRWWWPMARASSWLLPALALMYFALLLAWPLSDGP